MNKVKLYLLKVIAKKNKKLIKKHKIMVWYNTERSLWIASNEEMTVGTICTSKDKYLAIKGSAELIKVI